LKIIGHESKVVSGKHKEIPFPVVRRTQVEDTSNYTGLQRFYAHKIAHALFPENFFEPLRQEQNERVGHFWLTAPLIERSKLYSKEVATDDIYRHYLKHLYSRKDSHFIASRRDLSDCETCLVHWDRAMRENTSEDSLASQIRNAGINYHPNPVNIGWSKKGKPVFFELGVIGHLPVFQEGKLKTYVEELKDKRLQKKVLSYMKRYGIS